MNDNIFAPIFALTPVIESALENIDRQRWLVDNMLLMPKYETWIRREVSVKRAVGTTRIEGAGLDETEVSKLLNRTPGGNNTEDEQANLNALEAYDFVDFLSDQQDIPLDELVIRQLNRQFIRGAAETLTPGVYRKGQNTVGSFVPPDQGDVPGLMRSFTLWLRNEDAEIHPVLRAGIAHIHLLAIHPFWDGNGRTARGLTTLILQRSPFGFKKLLSLELGLSVIRDDYFTAIERTLGARFSLEYDATPWLEFFTLIMGLEAERLVGMLTDWHRMMSEVYEQAEARGWEHRHADALAFAHRTGQITRADYMEVTGVSPATASRDLAELVEAGALNPEGKTRSRIYRPVALEETRQQARPPEGQPPLLPEK